MLDMKRKQGQSQKQFLLACRQRRAAMARLAAQPVNMAEIGRRYGISRERVRQILNQQE